MNARATAISLNSIDEKVRSLEGTSRVVPIDMKSLDDRINNLIATAKEWQVINFRDYLPNGSTIDITSKYNIKLNSNSYVCFLNVRREGVGEATSSDVIKGDFTLNLYVRTTFIKRISNSIKLGCQSNANAYFVGKIIILN